MNTHCPYGLSSQLLPYPAVTSWVYLTVVQNALVDDTKAVNLDTFFLFAFLCTSLTPRLSDYFSRSYSESPILLLLHSHSIKVDLIPDLT